MRIVIVQDYLRCGGTERQSVHLARYFRAQDHEVCLLAFRPGGALEGEVSDTMRILPPQIIRDVKSGPRPAPPGARAPMDEVRHAGAKSSGLGSAAAGSSPSAAKCRIRATALRRAS